MAKKASKISSDENKALMSRNIATQTAAYLKQGGKVATVTCTDNAGYPSLVKKSRKQEAADLKKRRNFHLKPQDKSTCTKTT